MIQVILNLWPWNEIKSIVNQTEIMTQEMKLFITIKKKYFKKKLWVDQGRKFETVFCKNGYIIMVF